jgi:chitin disaccharide deacetylase
VNADDFGLTPGVNRGIIEAHERGIVTSASLMVRHAAAGEAACYGFLHQDLSLGLHFDFGEWQYRGGEWRSRYQVVATDDRERVHIEALHQLEVFRSLMDRNPTHLDSHQHVHKSDPVRSVLLELARSLSVPLRICTSGVQYCGSFYGQYQGGSIHPDPLTVEGLIRILESLPSGITELGCHPGWPEDLDSDYRDERAQEVRVLCDPRVIEALAEMDIILISFANSAIATVL